MERWNKGKLSEAYYQGKYASSGQDSRTGFKWGFADSITGDEARAITTVRTNHDDGGKRGATAAAASAPTVPAEAAKRPKQGPEAPDREHLDRYAADLRQKDKRDFRKFQNEVGAGVAAG